jgi:UDP-GlcNAc:undecaprenyl-phosphate GlcNAc-1-phosphate transferase
MSPLWPLSAAIGGLLLSYLGSVRGRHEGRPLLRLNYAGTPVPVVLGATLVKAGNTALLVALWLALLAGPVPDWPVPLLLFGGSYALFLVGSLDDRAESSTRGLQGHIAALGRGRVTTGIWKLLVGVMLAVVLAIALDGGIPRIVVSALVIALSVNVINALDVRPGRALKWALLPLMLSAFAVWGHGVLLPLAGYLGAGLAILPLDLRERGMLGDAGSNPLGLVLGTCLAAALPIWGLLVALTLLLGLQIAAETVTISRLIESVPPLRWFDRLGRRN